MNRTALWMVVAAWAGLASGCATLGSAIKVGGQMSGYNDLTDMGSSMEKAGREFNEEEKYYIGRTVAATLLAEDHWLNHAGLNAYVNAVGQTLVLASERPELFHGYHFAVQEAPGKVNAYACPGGFLFITSGLLKLCRNEDELAAVLAHEIAHIIREHPMQAIQASHQRSAMASLVKFGFKKVGESSEELSELSGLFDAVVKDVVKAVAHGYSRDKELEADLMAVDILGQAGYPPLALASVLGRMDRKSCYHGDPQVRAESVTAAAAEKTYGAKASGPRDQRFARETAK
jgi:beta-barrel assembly-enhancing protease